RNALPEIFEVFDFADPSVVTGRRNETITAPQALFMMNNAFPQQQARHAAQRILEQTHNTDDERLDWLYLTALGRLPSSAERRLCLDFLTQQPEVPLESWTQLVHSLLSSADFRYLR